jgi:hypothetical protein
MSTIIEKRITALESKLPKPKRDQKFITAMNSLWDGLELDAVPDAVTHCKPRLFEHAAKMLERMNTNTLTEKDELLLASIPECKYSVAQLLEATIEFENPQRARK